MTSETSKRAGSVTASTLLMTHLRASIHASAGAERAALKACQRGLERLEMEDFRTAAELFALAAELQNVLECAFLGAAIAHHHLGHVAATTYASQALTLHRLLAKGELTASYETLLTEIQARRIARSSTRVKAPKEEQEDKNYPEWSPWYGRYSRRYPKRRHLAGGKGFDEYFLSGLIPDRPFLTRYDRIASIGSCFAQNVALYLVRNGYCSANELPSDPDNPTFVPHRHLCIDDDFFNTFVMREAFDYAFGDERQLDHWKSDSYSRDRWRAYSSPVSIAVPEGPEKQHNPREISYKIDRVRAVLAGANAYIVTLGLAEVWYNRQTGIVYPSGLNIASFDPKLHGFRVSSVEENFENLEAIYQLIRKNRGDVPIITTLSPMALAATFRDFNCVAANTVSKATLRLAIDRLTEHHGDDPHLFYFPSYEIVRDYFPDPFDEDMRHVKPHIVDFVMEQFRRCYLADEPLSEVALNVESTSAGRW